MIVEEFSEVRAVCRLRAELETFAFGEMRGTNRASLHAKQRQLLKAMHAAAMAGDHARFYESDMAFHRAILDAADVPLLTELWRQTSERLTPWSRESFRTCWPSLMALYQEHFLLLESIETEQAGRIREALRHHLESAWQRMEFALEKNPAMAAPAERAAAFLSTHLEENFDLSWLAKNVSFVSASHLNRLFRERFGLPPHQWLQKMRMDRAAEILRQSESLSVAAAAQAVGYQDTSRFIAHFRKAFGATPRRFRRESPTA